MRAAQGGAPAEAEEEPDCPAHLLWIWEAFCDLSRTRVVNEAGPQPILLTEIKSYCDLESIFDEDDRHDLKFFVTQLDIDYCKEMHSRIEKEREKAKRKAGKSARR